jgi:hypothetical protein
MKKPNGSRFIIALVAGLTVAAVSCSQKTENSIVGKWSHGGKTKVTFTVNGTAINEENGKTETGEFSVSNVMTLNLKLPGAPATVVFDVTSLSDQEMVLTPRTPDAKPLKFTRLTN